MQEESLDLRHYAAVFLRRWWLLILAPVIAGGIAYVVAKSQTPVYQATTTILIQETRGSGLPSFSDISTSQQLGATYRELITSRPILEDVAEQLSGATSAGDMARLVSAEMVRGTQLLRIAARHNDPAMAARISDVVAETFKRRMTETRLFEIAQLQSAATAQGLSSPGDYLAAQMNALGSLSVVESAIIPTSPILPQVRRNVLLAIIVGEIIALMGALLLEYMYDTIQSPERAQRRFGVTAIGAIPRWSKKELAPYRLWLREQPSSNYAEAIRQARSNLQFIIAAHPMKILIVTSAGPGEGKSTLSSNLALALAETGLKVILVDTDLRRPSIHRFFGLDNSLGVTSYLAKAETGTTEILQDSGTDRLQVITSGPLPPNPGELLGTPRMTVLLEDLRARADFVVVDSPPTLVVADTANLITRCDGVLVVGDAQHTRMDALRHTLDMLKRANVPIALLVNKLHLGWTGYGYEYRYRYYHYYRYRNRSEDEAETKGPRSRKGANRKGAGAKA